MMYIIQGNTKVFTRYFYF